MSHALTKSLFIIFVGAGVALSACSSSREKKKDAGNPPPIIIGEVEGEGATNDETGDETVGSSAPTSGGDGTASAEVPNPALMRPGSAASTDALVGILPDFDAFGNDNLLSCSRKSGSQVEGCRLTTVLLKPAQEHLVSLKIKYNSSCPNSPSNSLIPTFVVEDESDRSHIVLEPNVRGEATIIGQGPFVLRDRLPNMTAMYAMTRTCGFFLEEVTQDVVDLSQPLPGRTHDLAPFTPYETAVGTNLLSQCSNSLGRSISSGCVLTQLLLAPAQTTEIEAAVTVRFACIGGDSVGAYTSFAIRDLADNSGKVVPFGVSQTITLRGFGPFVLLDTDAEVTASWVYPNGCAIHVDDVQTREASQ